MKKIYLEDNQLVEHVLVNKPLTMVYPTLGKFYARRNGLVLQLNHFHGTYYWDYARGCADNKQIIESPSFNECVKFAIKEGYEVIFIETVENEMFKDLFEIAKEK